MPQVAGSGRAAEWQRDFEGSRRTAAFTIDQDERQVATRAGVGHVGGLE